MDRTVSRPLSRLALRTLGLATLSALLVAGCTSDSGEDTTDDEPPASSSPTPEPVRFAALPEPCATLGEDTIDEAVPEADPAGGETLSSNDTATSAACLWSGLDAYQFRSLTVALRRFESDTAIGSGDDRAGEYVRQMAEEVTGDDANGEVDSAELGDTGDQAVTLGYSTTMETEEQGEQEYRQHRVIVRTGNVVITLDYAGAGFEGDDMPGADTIRENAEAAARAALEAVDASEGEQPEEGQEEGADEGADEGEEPPSQDARD
ncbi:DUF3558 domain-containing protein [Streptomyces radicis]|uniref:DUF3558 domain-containing protein n=1 Tax=Streptomyces radicis TaxID=1750517 RepID=A0A3A9WK07_9ACTN|nr:DUF3558 domain-containing protein [Streptomyces radicis]RKN09794.1 DUF3558 domain-containing protein [Streptomyces radicis]RKN23431.1 DUF3558 domain-containing protein [Streptomyces radicis]